MASVYKIGDLDNILTCAICLDRFQIPKVLSCQHTFCLQCLRRIVDNRQKSLTCPTCRLVVRFKKGPEELPTSVTIANLLDIQPVKAKCPSCDEVGALIICEHCHCTKCSNCNEKHIKEIEQSAKTVRQTLESMSQDDLKNSIHDDFRRIQSRITQQFQQLRLQNDSILLMRQTSVLEQLKQYEQSLIKRFDEDIQPLEKSKEQVLKETPTLNNKTEPELLKFLSKATPVQEDFAGKLAEHQQFLNSIEISLQYDPNLIEQINQMCNQIQLSLIHRSEDKSNQQAQCTIPSEPVDILLRTSLNREYKCRISLNQTIRELKEIFGKQENIPANRITVTKTDNFFDQLEDHRTLRSYQCEPSCVLMISIRR